MIQKAAPSGLAGSGENGSLCEKGATRVIPNGNQVHEQGLRTNTLEA